MSLKFEKIKKMNDLAAAMLETGGNKKAAAALAGISRPTAYAYLKDKHFVSVYENLLRYASLSALDNPQVLKGKMYNLSAGDLGEYFTNSGAFVGFDALTPEQRARIKRFTRTPSEHGEKIQIELYDQMKAIEHLARPQGVFDKVNHDVSLLDGLTDAQIGKIAEIVGWNESALEQEIARQVRARLAQLGRG